MLWDKAVWRGPPDPTNYGGSMVECRGLVLHIAEGTYEGTIGWMKNPTSDVSSHFVIGLGGEIAQMLDTSVTAWTQGAGNGHWVSVENAGFHTDQFTRAQIEANAQLMAWLLRTHGVKATIATGPNGYGLGHHGMGGAAWGGHPLCLPLDSTEVLTPTGWIPLGDVRPDHFVASVAMDSGILSFDRPVAIVAPYRSDLASIAGFEMTPDHRLYVHRSDAKSRKVLTASEAGATRTNWLIPCYGDYATAPGVAMDNDLLRLLVWVQADGHYENDGGAQPILHFHVSKRRKSERIVEILEALGVGFKYVVRRDGTVSIRVRAREWLRENVRSWLPQKTWEPWILQLSTAQFAVVDKEITQADGSEHGGQRFYFSSIRRNVDLVQALYVTHGRAASIYPAVDSGGYVLNLHTRRKALALRDSYRLAREGVEVGCLTTVNDTILIRQNGRVAVVGNCPGQANVALKPQILARAIAINKPPEDDMQQYFLAREGASDTDPKAKFYLCDGMLARGPLIRPVSTGQTPNDPANPNADEIADIKTLRDEGMFTLWKGGAIRGNMTPAFGLKVPMSWQNGGTAPGLVQHTHDVARTGPAERTA